MRAYVRLSLLTPLLLLALFACRDEPSTPASSAGESVGVLVRVNGVPITEADVLYWLRGAHGQEISEEMKASTLERLVEAELVYQQGLQLGLHRDAQYQRQVGALELGLRATQRSEMMKRVYSGEIAARVRVDDQETRAYYDANRERIAHELHLGVIQTSSRAKAEQVLEQIRQGRSFEELADATSSRKADRAATGWDLGRLPWSKIPLEWHETVYALEPGGVSEVFVGEQTGVVIFKLVERTAGPPPSFEAIQSAIVSRVADSQDARAYYEEHRDRIGQVLHLGMIPFADEKTAHAAREAIERGMTFEALADSQRRGHAEPGRSSWDLGFMTWSRIPMEWHDVVYGLQPGELSGVFEGKQTGVRIFKLSATRPAADADFTSVRNSVMNRLKEAKVRRAYEEYLASLEQEARIERIAPR